MHRLDLVRLQQEAGRGIPVPDSTMILGMSEALGGRMLLDVLSEMATRLSGALGEAGRAHPELRHTAKVVTGDRQVHLPGAALKDE